MSLRKQWNVQHVTTTRTPSLGANPTGKSLNSLKSIYVLGQVRIPNRDSIFKMRMDQSCIQLFQHFNTRISIPICWRGLEQIEVTCADQDKSDVNRILRYFRQTVDLYGSWYSGFPLPVTSILLHWTQLNCRLWTKIQSDITSTSCLIVWRGMDRPIQ